MEKLLMENYAKRIIAVCRSRGALAIGGMSAYAKLQENEFSYEKWVYTVTKHQREVGTGYFDYISSVISGGHSSTLANQGFTENEQFIQQ